MFYCKQFLAIINGELYYDSNGPKYLAVLGNIMAVNLLKNSPTLKSPV